jgi:lysophospholipase L1-like esterase
MALRQKKRDKLFKVLAIALPFLIVIIFEILLRIAGYGSDFSTFIQSPQNEQLLKFNPDIPKKYFTITDNAPPIGREVFKKIKDKNTFRIFVLGESTAQGYPYFHNGSFPRILKYRLERTYPDVDFEVINLAFTAINSYTLLDISDDVVQHQPDAVLIYSGHNEYYGALGVASTQKLGGNASIIKLLLSCKNLKVFQLLHKIYGSVVKSLNADVADQRETLMKRMAAQQKISFGSALYESGIEQYRNNLGEMLKLYQRNNIPVFIGTLINNERDIPPFISEVQDERRASEWKKLFDKGVELLSIDIEASEAFFEQANGVDSMHAQCHYYLAKIALQQGEYEKAKREFLKAKDFDLLRFRAPEQMNIVIKNLADLHRASVVDVAKAFQDQSPFGIPGKELITEHIHPNIAGYHVVANAFFNSLQNSSLIKMPAIVLSESQIRSKYPFTEVDSLSGSFEIMMLKEKWPFNEPIDDSVSSRSSMEARIAGGLAVKQYSWDYAMNLLYKHYEEQQNRKGMLQILEALALEYPYQLEYAEGAYQMSAEQRDWETSVYYARKCFELRPDAMNAKNVFLGYLRLDRAEQALPFVDFLIAQKSSPVDFNPMKSVVTEIVKLKEQLRIDSCNVHVLNAIADRYLLIGNQPGAAKYIQMTLKYDKGNAMAKKYATMLNN